MKAGNAGSGILPGGLARKLGATTEIRIPGANCKTPRGEGERSVRIPERWDFCNRVPNSSFLVYDRRELICLRNLIGGSWSPPWRRPNADPFKSQAPTRFG